MPSLSVAVVRRLPDELWGIGLKYLFLGLMKGGNSDLVEESTQIE